MCLKWISRVQRLSSFAEMRSPEDLLSKVRFLGLEIHEEKEAPEQILDTLHETECEMSCYSETLSGLNRREASGQEVRSAAAK
jgi:hypothetical protein